MTANGPLDGNGDDDDNPFAGVPFLGDLTNMLGQQGASGWESARQLAMSVATDGTSEANVEPSIRITLETLSRVAELQVANATGLDTTANGKPVVVVPVNRATWVHLSLEHYKPIFEALTTALKPAAADASSPGEGDDQMAMLSGLFSMLTPMMLAMTTGSMVGHLAKKSFGQYDLPIPRSDNNELLLVAPNVADFGDDWSISSDDLLLWMCLHEITHHAVISQPHVSEHLRSLLLSYAQGFTADGSAMENRLGSMDLSAGPMGDLESLFSDPELLLGASRGPQQQAVLDELTGLVAVIVGYVDHIMDVVGRGLVGDYALITEAIRRRRATEDSSSRFVERLLGLELTQSQFDRGAAFIGGVLERAGDEGLGQLWASAATLPTAPEVDAPGLWLERVALDLGDFDAGLDELLRTASDDDKDDDAGGDEDEDSGGQS